MTRAAFQRVGTLRAIAQGEDVEWFIRARDRGLRVGLFDEVTLHYRIHEANQRRISDEKTRHRGLLSGVRAALLRRRDEAGTNGLAPS